jgi:Ca2+-binding RTX toxin-like protein
VLDGGPGNDEITSNEGSDVYGGAGNDDITGGPGDPGGGSEDARPPPTGNDWLIGGHADNSSDLPDNDRIQGLGGWDYVYGGVGDDVLDGGAGWDNVMGGDGNDVVRGGSGHDNLDGPGVTQGRSPDAGSDTLEGGEGDDLLVGSHDNGAPDTFDCGPGTDQAEVGLNDQVSSDCEEVMEDVACPGPTGCTVDLVVSATGPPGAAASSASVKHRARKVILGSRRTAVNRGGKKTLEVRLDRGRLSKVLRGDGKAKALIEIKIIRKGKSKRVSRTPFGLRRQIGS